MNELISLSTIMRKKEGTPSGSRRRWHRGHILRRSDLELKGIGVHQVVRDDKGGFGAQSGEYACAASWYCSCFTLTIQTSSVAYSFSATEGKPSTIFFKLLPWSSTTWS